MTKTLLIAGEAQVTTAAGHPRGALLRAYDKATGKDAGSVLMPAQQSGSPMTYMLNGKQYIVGRPSAAGTIRASCSRSACRDSKVTQREQRIKGVSSLI